jgi:hypothetical protein
VDRGQGGRRGQGGGGPQPRPNVPRCNLEVREHSACLLMDEFQTLPNEQELVDWLEEEVWKDEEDARTQVMEGVRFLSIEQWAKRMILTLSTEEQVNIFLEVMRKEGERGRLWPGLEGEVRVRAEAMTKRSLVITVMDVAPETDKELVRGAMEKFGTVKRCERMTLPAPYNRVEINKMKVELVRNSKKMPNIIHAFGTARSAEDFLTWKLQYRGCPRYCYSCGATSHEARQCTERRAAREKLEKVASLVGEEQEEAGEAQLSYAAVLKDPTFLARQRREKDEEARRVAEREEQRTREREAKSAREEQDRREETARGGEAEWRERAEREREQERELGEERRERVELEEREQVPLPPEGNTPPPPAPLRSGDVKGVPRVEEEVPKVAPAPAQPKFLTPPQPREQVQEKKDTQQEGELKRGRNAEKMNNMPPGQKRDNTVVFGMIGRSLDRVRSTSAVKRRSSLSPSPRGSSKTSRTTEAMDHVVVDNNRNSLPSAGQGTDNGGASSPGPSLETLRDESPSGSPLLLDLGAAEVRGEVEEDWVDWVLEEEEKSEESKEEEEADRVEEGSKREEEKSEEESKDSEEESKDSEEESQESEEEEEVDQVEEVSKEEERSEEKSEERSEERSEEESKEEEEAEEEMIEELRRRLAHEAMGPPPVCRVRTLVPSPLAPAGSIMAVSRLSGVKPVRVVVKVDGKEMSLRPRYDGLPTVEILD